MKKSAIIIADSGFSADSLVSAKRILGVYDLHRRKVFFGNPYVEGGMDNVDLKAFADDSAGHGSAVLAATLKLAPDRPVVLIRSHNPEEGLILTSWRDGLPAADGWVEAYLWAVNLCRLHGLPSVANFSFGAVRHAADGTGWDAFRLGAVTGAGKRGHIALAAAGPGTARTGHASWVTLPRGETVVEAEQSETVTYNFWTATTEERLNKDFQLWVERNGVIVRYENSLHVPPNIWNGRKQITFQVEGPAKVRLIVKRGSEAGQCGFDCWMLGKGVFTSHEDPTLIVEPAVFPSVLAVGFKHGSYSPRQEEEGAKPDVLIDGTGFISFNLPRVVTKVADMLDAEPDLDVVAVKAKLGKHPSL